MSPLLSPRVRVDERSPAGLCVSSSCFEVSVLSSEYRGAHSLEGRDGPGLCCFHGVRAAVVGLEESWFAW